MKNALFSSLVLLSLSACGGSGGNTTTPTASPAPTPTETPTPTPTPVVATARTLAATAGPAAWRFYASPGMSDFLAAGYGTRDGEYFPAYRNVLRGIQGRAFGVDRNTDFSDQYKSVQLIDTNTNIQLGLDALPEAKIVSPLTHLLVDGPTQDKVKRQLGITENVFRLRTIDPDINTFDPIAELNNADPDIVADAQRLLAGNIRAWALIKSMGMSCDSSFVNFGSRELQTALIAAPDQFIFNDNATMTAVVASIDEFSALEPEVQSAIAHLVNVYAAAVALRIDRTEFASRFLLGIDGFLLPRIRELCTATTAEASMLAVGAQATNTQDVLDAIERFDEVIPATTDGFLFLAPDYYETSLNTQIILRDDGDSFAINRYPRENDGYATNSGNRAIGFLSGGIEISGVEVPAGNAGEISATINSAGTIILMPASGFTGVTYIDYTAQEQGESARGRIFVRVR